ncbi:MAG: hypothetical protein AB1742_03300 [bacterium]
MKNRIAVTGWHESRFSEENAAQSTPEMIFEASHGALRRAGLTREDIDTVVVGSCDTADGISISNVYSVGASGAFLKDESKIEADGSFALYYAVLRLLSGSFNTALVVSWGKGSNFSRFHYWTMQWEPFYTRPLGLSHEEILALQARAFCRRTGFEDKHAEEVLMKNLGNAEANGNAVRTLRGIQCGARGEMAAEPLRDGDLTPRTDGACAVVLENADRASRKKRIPISGFGLSTSTYFPFWRDLSRIASAGEASSIALKSAGWAIDDVDFFEVVERTPYHEAMLAEAMGVGLKDYLGGEMKRINLSGGALGADPEPATGLVRVVQAAKIIAGDCEKTANRVLTLGTSGLGYQTCIAFALGEAQ